jgi:serine/threonine protein kinase
MLPPDQIAGRTLSGRYHLERLLDAGGMGAVYEAVDRRGGERVAIKCSCFNAIASPDRRSLLKERFAREVQMMERLCHVPNVVRILDSGYDGVEGIHYLVMELLRGYSLYSYLSRLGAPPLTEALRLWAQTATTIQTMHDLGIIHRDLKGTNLFVVDPDAANRRIVVLDLGVSRFAEGWNMLTIGTAPHSPRHGAPEVVLGGQATEQSDVFSLGVVGFHLMTGDLPWSEAEWRAYAERGADDVLRKSLRRLPSAGIARMVERCLHRSPVERYPSARALTEAIHQAESPRRSELEDLTLLLDPVGETSRFAARSDSRPVADLHADELAVPMAPRWSAPSYLKTSWHRLRGRFESRVSPNRGMRPDRDGTRSQAPSAEQEFAISREDLQDVLRKCSTESLATALGVAPEPLVQALSHLRLLPWRERIWWFFPVEAWHAFRMRGQVQRLPMVIATRSRRHIVVMGAQGRSGLPRVGSQVWTIQTEHAWPPTRAPGSGTRSRQVHFVNHRGGIVVLTLVLLAAFHSMLPQLALAWGIIGGTGLVRLLAISMPKVELTNSTTALGRRINRLHVLADSAVPALLGFAGAFGVLAALRAGVASFPSWGWNTLSLWSLVFGYSGAWLWKTRRVPSEVTGA